MACVGCRSVRLKCEKQEGGKCKRCEEKSLDCVLHARKRRAPSGSCERCVRLHKACSLKGGSEDEAVRCHECLRLNAVCEPFDPSKSAKVDEEPSVEALPIVGGEENLSVESLSIGEETFSVANRAVLGLALRAPSHLLIQELEKLPPSDVPGIFGLGSKTLGSTWLLVAIPPPGPEGFTHEGFHKGTRIVSGSLRAPFDLIFDLESVRGKSWWDLQCCKTPAEFEQLKCMLQRTPGPAHIRVALEVTRGLRKVGETAIVIHSVFGSDGRARLQFLSFSLVDQALLSTRDRSAFADLDGLDWLDDFEFGAVAGSSIDEGMQFFDLDMII